MKILIADDELPNRILMNSLLASWGACDLVVDGAEAVEAFELAASEGQPYDLICMDLFMPVMNGDEALRAMRILEKEMGIPPQFATCVCMITGLEQGATAADLYFQGGSTATLMKPVNREQLYAKLQEFGFPPPAGTPDAPALPAGSFRDALHTIPGLDVASGLERMMGSVDLYRELLQDFLQDHENDVEKIRKAMEVGNKDIARRLAHSIKGTAGNLSAMTVHLTAKALEDALRHDHPPETCAERLAGFTEAMNTFMPAVRGILAQP
ncbi:MAG: response regulator [Magnetococcales bacterium]|nr:response regulator [Magnetococcales bacterium]